MSSSEWHALPPSAIVALAALNKACSRFGDFLMAWIGSIFVMFMIIALFGVCRFLSGPMFYDESTIYILEKTSYFIVFEILLNLYLFHHYATHNSVFHWQRQACIADLCRKANEDDENTALWNDAEMAENGDLFGGAKETTNRNRDVKYCEQCNHVAPIRSHHCALCKMCVLRKDHHCFVTGGCVGLGNQRYFIVFLFWACIGLLIAIPLLWNYLDATVYPWYPLGWLTYAGPISIFRWVLGYCPFSACLLSSLFSFAVGGLLVAAGFFCMNIFYTASGFTMWEYHSASIREAFDGDGNTLGERFRLVFGENWLLNFIIPQVWNPPLLTPKISNNIFRVRSKLL